MKGVLVKRAKKCLDRSNTPLPRNSKNIIAIFPDGYIETYRALWHMQPDSQEALIKLHGGVYKFYQI